MKYLPLEKFEAVTNALNFSTPTLHVMGGCDVYTTKAAGRDKKLYKDIDSSLEAHHQSLVRLSASLSPPLRASPGKEGPRHRTRTRRRSTTADLPEINLSRDSPFGPLSQPSSRRTFAYLVATLNAAHPDYDFSHILKPQDFHHERSLKGVMQHIDATLHHLRPRYNTPYLSPPLLSSSASMTNHLGNEIWSPRMWSLIDTEMDLRVCQKYSYSPNQDPFDDDDGGSIWNMHYFFFNPERKRVCYLYARGLSVISHSPVNFSTMNTKKAAAGESGSMKRADYWLGSGRVIDEDESMDFKDRADSVIVHEADDEDLEYRDMDPDQIRAQLTNGYYEDSTNEFDEYDEVVEMWDEREMQERKHVRGMSEEIGDAMDI